MNKIVFFLHYGSISLKIKTLCMFIALLFVSCDKHEEIYNRLEKIEKTLFDVNSAVNTLQDVYSKGVHIQSVAKLDGEIEGWKLDFSNGMSLNIVNGLITSLEENEDGLITIALSDGRKFIFNTRYVMPTSISILAVDPLWLSWGTRDTIEFRVNPSNATFTFAEEGCQIELDRVGTQHTRSYVTKPDAYHLEKIEPVYDESTGEIKVGQYKAIIEDSRRATAYNDIIALVLNTKDVSGKEVQVSSSAIGINASSFSDVKYGLPIVVVNTPNAVSIDSKEVYVENSLMTLLDDNHQLLAQGEIKIKGRGNSTWGFKKKPYKMKFSDKVSLFDGEKDKEWILLANFLDYTKMRTGLTYMVAKSFGRFDYVPSFNYVDLILNNSYKGTYQIGDQLKIAKGRVLNGKDGYLLEVDVRAVEEAAAGEAVIFYAPGISNPFNIKDLKIGDVDEVVENDPNYNYVKNYVVNAANVLYSDNWLDSDTGYNKFIDKESFVDWYLINEISKNCDAIFYSSCYMTLGMSEDSKLQMGPLWDYDIAYGLAKSNVSVVNATDGFYIKDAGWYPRLFEDPEFVQLVKKRFDVYYQNLPDIINYIDQTASYLEASVVANDNVWFRLSTIIRDYDEIARRYNGQVEMLKNWITERMGWLKAEYDKM